MPNLDLTVAVRIAIGYGIAGEVLNYVLGVDEETAESFPAWVAKQVN